MAARLTRTAGLAGLASLALIGASVIAAPAAMATGAAPEPVCTDSMCTVTFGYIGDSYEWTVPDVVSGPITFELRGAMGGGDGGLGAALAVRYTATPGETIVITPGGSGGTAFGDRPGGGGFNGGAAGYAVSNDRIIALGSGGGGATDIRVGGAELSDRVAVAPGGGGGAEVLDKDSGIRYYGMGGGGTVIGANGTGQTAGRGTSGLASGGAGGQASADLPIGGAGMLGVGGAGVGNDTNGAGGGGGGGWYGGGGGTTAKPFGAGGGAGGSVLIDPAVSAIGFLPSANNGNGSVVATFGVTDAPMFINSSPDAWIAPASTATPAARAGSAYEYQFTATGTPAPTYSVAKGELPPGLALDAATGMLAGTPTVKGTFTFSVAATNDLGVATSKEMSITVDSAPMFMFPSVTEGGIPPLSANANASFRYEFSVGGSPTPTVTVASGALPPGVRLTMGSEPGSVVLSGTPTSRGIYFFSLRAKNSAGAVTTKDIPFLVFPEAPILRYPQWLPESGDVDVSMRTMPSSKASRVSVEVLAQDPRATGADRPWVPIASGTRKAVNNKWFGVEAGLNAQGKAFIKDRSSLPVHVVVTTTYGKGQKSTSMAMTKLRMK